MTRDNIVLALKKISVEKMKIFLVCPVRKIGKKEYKMQQEYVAKMEAKGHEVHWPHPDTKQNDPTGIKIITTNRQAVANSDEIHFWWKADKNGKTKSYRSVFDFGMAWMLKYFYPETKMIIANPLKVNPSKNKSFTNVLLLLDSVDSIKTL